MVDAVLTDSGGTQRRLRKLPARVVVYLLLAAALFEHIGYPAVWRKLTSPLEGLPVPKITATALWHARTRLGPGPMQALFDLLRGRPPRPAPPAPDGPGCWCARSTAPAWMCPTVPPAGLATARAPINTPPPVTRRSA